jgi:hypothetical protein
MVGADDENGATNNSVFGIKDTDFLLIFLSLMLPSACRVRGATNDA